MTFPLGTAPSYYATCSYPNRRNGIHYVGDTVVVTLSQATPTAYYVKDYYGNTVSSGSTSGTTCSPTAPGGGWLPGWYRIYFTGASTDAVYGPSYGATNFCVIRPNAHFPAMPNISVKGNGSPGHHGSPPDLITRGAMGMATSRLTIAPMPDPNNGPNDRLIDVALDAPLATAWWTTPPTAYLEPGRNRYLWVAFENRTFDRININNSNGTLSLGLFAKDEAAAAVGDKIFIGISAGTVSGDKYTVYYPDAVTVVETYDNMATVDDATLAINAASTRVWAAVFHSGNRPVAQAPTAIGNAYYNGVKQSSNTLVPLGVDTFEGPLNEPVIDLSMGQKMRVFRAGVKAGNTNGHTIGPAVVNITDLAAWQKFFDGGAQQWVDGISFHDYNTVLQGDMNQGRAQIEPFLALLAANGWTGPLWQTEAQSVMSCVYGVHHPRRARTCFMHMLLWEQYGLPRERNCYWYDYSIGFWGFPVWAWNGDASSQPQVPMYRTLTEETFNMPHHHRVYFGSPAADAIFLGSVYGSADTFGPTTLVLLSASFIPDATVTISVAGSNDPLTIVNAFGETATVPLSSGLADIPVEDVPTYVRLPAGATVSIHSVLDWGASPNPNVAGVGTATLGGVATSGVNNGQFLGNYAAYPGGVGINYSTVTVPDDIVVDLGQTATVDRVIIWCGPYWQSMSVLTDFDIDTSNDGSSWTTQTTITRSMSSFLHGTNTSGAGCSRETYSDEQWIFPVTLPSPVSCRYVRAHVRATTYGGEPDAAAIAAGGGATQGAVDQRVGVQEMMVTSSSTVTGGTAPVGTVAPVVTGNTKIGLQLTCGTGSWSNVPTSYTYQWKRNGVNVSTGPDYLKTGADVGHTINCVVTATNAAGSASQTSNSITLAATRSAIVGMVSI